MSLDDPMNLIGSSVHGSLAVAEFSASGILLAANDIFLGSLGYTLDEIKGCPHSALVDEQTAASQSYIDLWDALRNGEKQTADVRRRSKSGECRWLKAWYTPVPGPDGTVAKIIKVAADITAEKDAAAEKEMLSLVADNTQNSVVITDSEGRITYTNNGFTRMTGYTFAEARGRKPSFLQGPDTDPATVSVLSRAISLGRPVYEEIINYRKDGRPYWISLAIDPVPGPDGKPECFVSIQAEITSVKLRWNARI